MKKRKKTLETFWKFHCKNENNFLGSWQKFWYKFETCCYIRLNYFRLLCALRYANSKFIWDSYISWSLYTFQL